VIVGIEVGGTFTDLVSVDEDGNTTIHKVPSTPSDPSVAAVQGFAELLAKVGREASSVTELLHGSTIAANALIQRRGAKTALITTRGFRDVLFIQRQDKTTVYDMFYQKPEPLIGREMAREVTERMSAKGEIVTPLDRGEVEALVDELVKRDGVTSIAVCLIHAYANPAHEREIGEIIQARHPEVYVSLSSDIAPEHREYERTSTAVISAFIRPAVDVYLSRFSQRARELGFKGTPLIMQSNGGVVPVETARKLAANMFLSGPAAAATGAAYVAQQCETPNVITIDVGGTSSDVCLITGGAPQTTVKGTAEFSVDGLPLNIVMTDIVSIGAGGGSISWVDPGGMLQVGPQSSGAAPGPSCYGRGGKDFCLTDAMLLLGLLDPALELPGGIRLDPAASETAAGPLCERFGLTPVELAERVYRIATANMAQALRRVSVKRGYDPRDYTLFACGGAGPLIAVALAEEIGIRHVILPPDPGIFSAYGLSVSDVKIDYVLAEGAQRADALTQEDLVAKLDSLAARAIAEFATLGYPESALAFDYAVDARYVGQGYELRVPIERDGIERDGVKHLTDGFHARHEQQYGHSFPTHKVESISFRLSARRPRAHNARPRQTPHLAVDMPARQVRLGGRTLDYVQLRRENLPLGYKSEGPQIIIEESTSTPVVPGWTVELDRIGVLHLHKQ